MSDPKRVRDDESVRVVSGFSFVLTAIFDKIHRNRTKMSSEDRKWGYMTPIEVANDMIDGVMEATANSVKKATSVVLLIETYRAFAEMGEGSLIFKEDPKVSDETLEAKRREIENMRIAADMVKEAWQKYKATASFE